jgi:glycosyltransferase involved in cell wall biosynthesis
MRPNQAWPAAEVKVSMRILYVSPFPPERDGIGTYTEAIAGVLRTNGNEVRVIAVRAESLANPAVLALLPTRRADLLALRDQVLAWQPDCIHVQFAVAAFGVRTPALLSWLRLMRSTKIPIVITMHEVTRDIGRLRSAGGLIYRSIGACCDQIIVHTQAAFAECVRTARVPIDRISVIPHPTPSPPHEAVTSDELRRRFHLNDDVVLLAFGFIHVDKGLPDLVTALRILRSMSPSSLDGVRVVIAGSVRRRSGLFRLFELQDRIHLRRVRRMGRRGGVDRYLLFTGYVPADEVAGWFRAATAVVLPYRRTEQSGVAALAHAFGVPALASAVGGLRELYGNSGWTFPPRDPHAIARVVAAFIARPVNSTVARGKRHTITDLAVVVSATTDIYQDMIAAWERNFGVRLP